LDKLDIDSVVLLTKPDDILTTIERDKHYQTTQRKLIWLTTECFRSSRDVAAFLQWRQAQLEQFGVDVVALHFLFNDQCANFMDIDWSIRSWSVLRELVLWLFHCVGTLRLASVVVTVARFRPFVDLIEEVAGRWLNSHCDDGDVAHALELLLAVFLYKDGAVWVIERKMHAIIFLFAEEQRAKHEHYQPFYLLVWWDDIQDKWRKRMGLPKKTKGKEMRKLLRAASPIQRGCGYCGGAETDVAMFWCGRAHTCGVRFCNVACQRKEWKRHVHVHHYLSCCEGDKL
jgi:hypothetical protein